MWWRFLYRSYRQFYGAAYRLSRRFTAAGKFALACLVVAATLGLDTSQTTAYQAFTFLAAAFAVAFLWTVLWRGEKQLTARRVLPRFGTAGQPVVYHVTVRNDTPRRQCGLVLLEDLEDPRPSLQEFVTQLPRRMRGLTSRLDEWLGYARWRQLVARRQPAVVTEQRVPDLLPRRATDVRVEFVPQRRGRVRFTGLTLARMDVLGLVRRHLRRPQPQSFMILPKRYILPPIALPGTRQYQQGGVALATSVGQSDEFVSLRDYRPGDPPRHIHWRSVAKADRLITREYEDEFFARHALVFDTFAAPGREEVFEEAVSVAASFVCTIQTQESLLDLLFVGPEAYCFTAGRGVGHADQMLEVLAGVGICAEKSFPSLETLVVRHAALVSGGVCVFLAWDEPRQQLVRRLRALQVPVRVCVVTDDESPAPLDPGVMRDEPHHFHHLRMGKIQEGLARW